MKSMKKMNEIIEKALKDMRWEYFVAEANEKAFVWEFVKELQEMKNVIEEVERSEKIEA